MKRKVYLQHESAPVSVKRTFCFSEAQFDRFLAYSKKSGVPMAEILRRALEAYLKDVTP